MASSIIALMLSNIVILLLATILAWIVSFLAMLGLLKSNRFPMDRPNERSLHSVPVPRSGGIAITAGVAAGTLVFRAEIPTVALFLVLALFSFIDDRRQLSALIRLVAHILTAAGFIWIAGISANPLVLLLLLLAMTWFMNLYNFMDGADGLAGGMAVIGFCAYATAAFIHGNEEIGGLSLFAAAAVAAFLMFNFPPARIFMGDVGSIPLGFLASALGLLGWHEGTWSLTFPLVVFAPFCVDATVTLLKRAARGQRVWLAHREHYYQRLVLSGWTHRRLALAEYLLMAVCALCGLALVVLSMAAQIVVVSLLVLGFAGLMFLADWRWRCFSRTTHG
jgi:UDP-GlcNAc:undecaprenyl-phosphate GlcNAc-1-phosphate transferase